MPRVLAADIARSLRQRIESAKERLRVLAGRLSFLEQHGGGNAA